MGWSGGLRGLVKRVLRAVAPGPAARWQIERERRHNRRFEEALGLPRITKEYVSRNGLEVRHGPFRGLRYPRGEAAGNILVTKLVGSYESELWPAWDALLARGPEVVVDIGCAEGFFAVGLARLLPGARVYAYDAAPEAQALCRAMAEGNGVAGRVDVRGRATFEDLAAVMGGERSLVVCDCDGCEAFVLDPARVPALHTADVLVEVHDHLDPTITPTLRARFEQTHDIEYVPSVPKDPAPYPELAFLDAEDRSRAVSEWRPQQGWLVMVSRQRGGPAAR